MIRWWSNLSVTKKLSVVVGLMAVLIASELFTLFFAMNTLSAVRAFVAGEGLWTKAQKDALHSLYQYALHGEEKYYSAFQRNLDVPAGDHIARLELSKPNFDYETARKGFLQGGNHPNDIHGMIQLLKRFHRIHYLKESVGAWTRADDLLDEITRIAEDIHRIIQKEGKSSRKVESALKRISDINTELTQQENLFSSSLGAGSRWLERVLMTILALTVLTIESTGLFLTYRFSRNLSRSLKELRDTAQAVGEGNRSKWAPVHSKDELGQLAGALNQMIRQLSAGFLEKKRNEETLRRSEERFRLLVEAVNEYAIFMLDPDGNVTTWNSGAEKIHGYSAHEILGKFFSIFYTPADIADHLPERILRTAVQEGHFESEGFRVRKNGSTFWSNVVITPLYDRGGQLAGFSKVTQDITARKESEFRLRKLNEELEKRVEIRTSELQWREAQLRLITDALPVLIAQLDTQERFQFSNEAFCRWFGLTQDQVIGKTFREVLSEERYPDNRPYIQKALAGQTTTYERFSASGDLSAIYQITFVPEFDSAGAVVGFILVANDITKYKEIALELKKAKEAADAASMTKSAFLANMSHEIRTPLGAVLGFSELLLENELTAEEKVVGAEIIRRNGQLLSTIINDILDLSKVEAGKLEVEKVNVPFKETVTEIESLLNLKAIEKGLKLVVRSHENVPERLQTDPLRLRQILLNIIGNAVKFTNKGSVSVEIEMVSSEDGSRKLRFLVSDTGKGIKSEQVGRLFEPFTQADPSTTRKFGGTGLGLVLSKKLAQALGGDVVLIESSPEVGSTFAVTIDPGNPALPVSQPSNAIKRIAGEAHSAPFNRFKILLVDDSFDNQIIVDHFLRKTGALIETANNGKEGVEKALEGNFEMVFMDLQMPVMDGYEAVRALRQRGYQKPVIALTAHAMKEESRRCLESGFDAHLSKPLSRELLLQALSNYGGLQV